MWLNEFLTLLVAFPLLSSSLALERAETPPRGLVRVVNVVASGAAADSDPTDLQIGSEGSGCRPGTVSTVVAEDNTFMTLAFDDFQATVGPGATYKKRAFCRVTATLSSPGWGFDVDNVDFRGYYKLDKGVNASVRASYKFVEQKGKVCSPQTQLSHEHNLTYCLHREAYTNLYRDRWQTITYYIKTDRRRIRKPIRVLGIPQPFLLACRLH